MDREDLKFAIASALMFTMLALFTYVVALYIAEKLSEFEAARAPQLCVEIENNTFLKFEGFKAKYRVYVNGGMVWRGLDAYQWSVKTTLRGAAEVKVTNGKDATFYVVRLPNGTYVLVYGNVAAKRVCIR